ncbi:MAG: hypothetical protein ACRC5M_07455, partial [Anaeroplasmataceae bacterium]
GQNYFWKQTEESVEAFLEAVKKIPTVPKDALEPVKDNEIIDYSIDINTVSEETVKTDYVIDTRGISTVTDRREFDLGMVKDDITQEPFRFYQLVYMTINGDQYSDLEIRFSKSQGLLIVNLYSDALSLDIKHQINIHLINS